MTVLISSRKLARLSEMTRLLVSYFTSLGRLSTKKHEFGDVFFFENLIETTSVFIVPACRPRVQRLMKSFAQDLMFGGSRGKIKPPNQISFSLRCEDPDK